MHRSVRSVLGLVATATLACSAVHAQWTSDASVNTLVAGGGGDQTVPIIKPTQDGGAWVFFYDNGGGAGYKPTAQRLSAGGVPQLPGNGVVLANRTNTAVFTSDAEVDAVGNLYAVFDDNSSGSNRVTVQKVETSGNLPWGAAGLDAANLAGSLGNRIAVCADATIVVCGSVSNVLQFQRATPTGVMIPGASWNVAEATRGQSPSDLIAGDFGGDVILLWIRSETTNLVTSRKGLKIQKWSASAAPLWSGPGGPGTPIDIYTSNQTPSRQIGSGYFPTALPDGTGGAVVSWYDTGATLNAWIQHVSGAGVQRFAQDGLAVSTTPAATERRLSSAAIYLASTDEYVVAFERSNPSQSLFGLGAQRISGAGSLQWGGSGEGIEILPLATGNHKSFVNVQPTPGGTAIVAWLEYQGASGPMIVQATRLDASGAAMWSPALLDVASTPSSKGRLTSTVVTGSDMLVLAWQDGAAGSADIKAQNLYPSGELGEVACPGDVNGDGLVNLSDLSLLLAAFGTSSGDAGYNAGADFNNSGTVDLSDLSVLLANFGTTCP